MTSSAPAKSQSIQGLRAIAVLAVVAYHLNWRFIQGGFLGVDLFFVLSGFLITSLALHEIRATSHFSWTGFIARRARRIMPASLALLAVVLVYGQFGGWDAPPGQDVRWASLYVANWHFVFAETGYGAELLSPSPVLHFWSLAIEEQWYIIFPILMVVLSPFVVKGRRILLTVFGSLAALSAGWMIVLSHSSGWSVSRGYFGTDTRLFAILLGAVGATVLPLGTRIHSPVARLRGQVATVLGLAVLAVLFVVAREQSLWMYRGGFVLAAFASLSAILGASVSEPRILTSRVLGKIGDLSYSIYLWHWPVIVATSSERLGFGGIRQLALRAILISLFSVGSYRFIETPLLRRRNVSQLATGIRTSAAVVVLGTLVLVSFLSPGSFRGNSVAASLDELNQGAENFDPLADFAEQVDTFPTGTRLTVMIAGDSVPFGLGWKFRLLGTDKYLEAKWGVNLTVVNGAVPGCGIFPNNHGDARFDCIKSARFRTRLVATTKPDVIVYFLGTQDQLDLVFDDVVVKMESPNWKSEFDTYVRREFSEIMQSSTKVIVLESPCVIDTRPQSTIDPANNETDEARRALLNDYFREFAKTSSPPLTILNPEEFLCPDGNVIKEIAGDVVRTDGIHYSDAGMGIFWDWMTPKLLSVVPRPSSTATTVRPQN